MAIFRLLRPLHIFKAFLLLQRVALMALLLFPRLGRGTPLEPIRGYHVLSFL